MTVERLDPEPGVRAPGKLSLLLTDDGVDALHLHTYVNAANGAAVTACREDSIYRIGPNAVDWPVGMPFTLPLSYAEELPNGLYRHVIRIQRATRTADLSIRESDSTELFEVSDDGIEPRREPRLPPGEVLSVARADQMLLPTNPCPPFPTYSDRTELETASTLVDLGDEWAGTGSIQPLRWRESPVEGGGATSSIFYQTMNDAGTRLRFRASVSAEALAAGAQLDFSGSASLSIVPDLYTRAGRWFATGGTVAIHRVGEQGVAIELSDLVFGNEPESLQTRSIKSASIVGALKTHASEPD